MSNGIYNFLEFTYDNGASWKPIVFIGENANESANYHKDDWSGASAVPTPKISQPFTVAGDVTTIRVRVAANDGKDRPGADYPINTGRAACFAGGTEKEVGAPVEITISLTVNEGDYISIPFAVNGAKNLSFTQFKIEYDPEDYELVSANEYDDTTVTIIGGNPDGMASFKVNRTIPSGQTFTGIVNSIKSKAKRSGKLQACCKALGG